MQYTFLFTIEQVNDIIDCMKRGEYGKVNSIIHEFNRQIQAQVTTPPKTDGQAQPASPNGSGTTGPL